MWVAKLKLSHRRIIRKTHKKATYRKPKECWNRNIR